MWCQEHGRYEDRCWECHPELRDPKRPYCEEHGLYEDECSLCDPSRAKKKPAPTSAGHDLEGETEKPAKGGGHAHAEAGQTCFICDPSKREPGRLWCQEHGRYEDRCWECHPELRDSKRPYCEEHGLYEDECSLCDPSRKPKAQATTPKRSELFCKEHRVPEHQCGICRPQAAGALEVGQSLLVRLASARSADLAGLTISRPAKVDGATTLALLGEVRFNGNRLARVTPLAAGVLAEVRGDVGDNVDAGAVLAIVNAPGVAEAKAEYLSTRADLRRWRAASERQKRLFDEKVGARRKVEESAASYRLSQVANRLARARLQNLGFSDEELARIRDARSQLPLRAPFQGTIVKRSAVLGEAVDARAALFVVADLSQMWVDISVPEEHAARIRVGTPIQVKVQAGRGTAVEGRITWVSPIVDERTRMVGARGILPNEDRLLRDGMFADVRAIIDTHPGSVRLPASAVHRVDNLPFVFVRQEKDLFAARRVELGDRLPPDDILIHGGVQFDDAVVMSGGFTMKSALLASRLGAGCTDD